MNIRLLTAAAFALIFAAVSADSLCAAEGRLAYVEGNVILEKTGGIQKPAEIGENVSAGDTLYTASDSRADLELLSGSTVIIGADSVFNVGEIADSEAETRKKGFFRVLLGSVSFKFRNLTQEPEIGTPLTVCSVRGTDFTVYTAPDGTSMTVVSDGLVEVTSGRAAALLSAGQGVKAVVGLGLGEPFEAKKGHIRYEDFVDEALTRMDEDPSLVLISLIDQMKEYVEQGEFFVESYRINREKVIAVREQVNSVFEDQGKEAGEKMRQMEYLPLQERGLDLALTSRYYILSAFMMRRYTFSSLYIHIRCNYLQNPNDPIWSEFSTTYQKFLDIYDNRLIPLLEEEDL